MVDASPAMTGADYNLIIQKMIDAQTAQPQAMPPAAPGPGPAQTAQPAPTTTSPSDGNSPPIGSGAAYNAQIDAYLATRPDAQPQQSIDNGGYLRSQAAKGAAEGVTGLIQPEANLNSTVTNAAIKGLSAIAPSWGQSLQDQQAQGQKAIADTASQGGWLGGLALNAQFANDPAGALIGLLRRNGWIDNSQPSSEAMRVAGRAVEGGTSALTNPLSWAGGIVPGLAMSAGGTVGGGTGELARFGAQQAGAGPVGQTVADIGGNLVGSYPGAAIGAKVLNQPSAAAQEFTDAQVSPLPGQVAANSPNTSILPFADQGLTTRTLNPFTPGATRSANARTVSSWQDAMDNATDALSPVQGKDAVGQLVQDQAQNWVDQQKSAADAVYGPIKDSMSPTVTAPPAATQSFLSSVQPSAKGASLPSIIQDVSDAIKSAPQKGVPGSPAGEMSYPDLDYWAQTVRKFRNSTEYDNLVSSDKAKVNDLYTALKNDSYAVANLQQDGAGNALAAADANYADFINFAPKTMKTLTDNNLTGSQIWNRIRAGSDPDATQVATLVQKGVLDRDAQNAIAAQVVRSAGIAPNGTWQPSLFLRNYAKLSDTAKQNLFGSNQAQYDRLANIANQIAQAKMPSKSILGRLPGFGADNSVEEGVGIGAGEHIVNTALGHLGTLGLGAITGIVPWAMSRLMAKPWFVNQLSKPVYTVDKARAALQALANMHPESAGDINAVTGAMQDPQGSQ